MYICSSFFQSLIFCISNQPGIGDIVIYWLTRYLVYTQKNPIFIKTFVFRRSDDFWSEEVYAQKMRENVYAYGAGAVNSPQEATR